MDHFAKIFICYQKMGKANNDGGKFRGETYSRSHGTNHLPSAERAKLREELDPWCKKNAKGKMRADSDGDKFTIKYGPIYSIHLK
jgi:hypothetical protein